MSESIFPVEHDIQRLRGCTPFGGETLPYTAFSDGEEYHKTLERVARYYLAPPADPEIREKAERLMRASVTAGDSPTLTPKVRAMLRDQYEVAQAFLLSPPPVGEGPANGWLPISTAPSPPAEHSDWVRADVWAVTHFDSTGYRYADSSLRQNGKWYDSGGNPLEWEAKNDDGSPAFRRVTHWKPILSPKPLPVAQDHVLPADEPWALANGAKKPYDGQYGHYLSWLVVTPDNLGTAIYLKCNPGERVKLGVVGATVKFDPTRADVLRLLDAVGYDRAASDKAAAYEAALIRSCSPPRLP